MRRNTNEVQLSHPGITVKELGRGTRRADTGRIQSLVWFPGFFKVAQVRTVAIKCGTVHRLSLKAAPCQSASRRVAR